MRSSGATPRQQARAAAPLGSPTTRQHVRQTSRGMSRSSKANPPRSRASNNGSQRSSARFAQRAFASRSRCSAGRASARRVSRVSANGLPGFAGGTVHSVSSRPRSRSRTSSRACLRCARSPKSRAVALSAVLRGGAARPRARRSSSVNERISSTATSSSAGDWRCSAVSLWSVRGPSPVTTGERLRTRRGWQPAGAFVLRPAPHERRKLSGGHTNAASFQRNSAPDLPDPPSEKPPEVLPAKYPEHLGPLGSSFADPPHRQTPPAGDPSRSRCNCFWAREGV
jgi:hypothetical protein